MLLGFLARKLRYMNNSRRHDDNRGSGEEQRQPEIGESLSKNLEELRQLLGNDSDLKVHFFRFGENGWSTAASSRIPSSGPS